MSEIDKPIANRDHGSYIGGGPFRGAQDLIPPRLSVVSPNRIASTAHSPFHIVSPYSTLKSHGETPLSLPAEARHARHSDQDAVVTPETDDSQLRIASFRDLVEIGLQNYFGEHSRYSELAGQLSVHPERVGEHVTPEVLNNQCDDFSREFQRIEREAGLVTQLAVSDEGYNEHIYLVPDESHGLPDVVIDLTLGQYVRGYNHAFVGTREELRDIFVHQTGDGKPYTLEEPAELLEPEEVTLYMEPLAFFQRKWGETSIIV